VIIAQPSDAQAAAPTTNEWDEVAK
jgi:hypothetical protein